MAKVRGSLKPLASYPQDVFTLRTLTGSQTLLTPLLSVIVNQPGRAIHSERSPSVAKSSRKCDFSKAGRPLGEVLGEVLGGCLTLGVETPNSQLLREAAKT